MPNPKKKVKKENEHEVKVSNDSTEDENPTDIGPGITERYKDA
jgi:hypothetical protein